MNKLILASGSPRRKELLEMAGFDFEVVKSGADETLPRGMRPADAVKYLSKLKAFDVLDMKGSGYTVLGSDTVVSIDDKILGKPKDEDDAKSMLEMLSGKTHSVYTGVTICSNEKSETFSVRSDVTFFDLTKEEIENYIKTKEPMDKAGAYGIQGKGSLLVKSVSGDFFNIVGLPISLVYRRLKAF